MVSALPEPPSGRPGEPSAGAIAGAITKLNAPPKLAPHQQSDASPLSLASHCSLNFSLSDWACAGPIRIKPAAIIASFIWKSSRKSPDLPKTPEDPCNDISNEQHGDWDNENDRD